MGPQGPNSITYEDLLPMVLYGITLVLLVEDPRAVDPGLLAPFYTDYATFEGLTRRSVWLMRLPLEWGKAQGYFTEISKSLFIPETNY